jgi:hypothetical protein
LLHADSLPSADFGPVRSGQHRNICKTFSKIGKYGDLLRA